MAKSYSPRCALGRMRVIRNERIRMIWLNRVVALVIVGLLHWRR